MNLRLWVVYFSGYRWGEFKVIDFWFQRYLWNFSTKGTLVARGDDGSPDLLVCGRLEVSPCRMQVICGAWSASLRSASSTGDSRHFSDLWRFWSASSTAIVYGRFVLPALNEISICVRSFFPMRDLSGGKIHPIINTNSSLESAQRSSNNAAIIWSWKS